MEGVVSCGRSDVIVVSRTCISFNKCSDILLAGRCRGLLIYNAFSGDEDLTKVEVNFTVKDGALVDILRTIGGSCGDCAMGDVSVTTNATTVGSASCFGTAISGIVTAERHIAGRLEGLKFAILSSRAGFVFTARNGGDVGRCFRCLGGRGIFVECFGLPEVSGCIHVAVNASSRVSVFLTRAEGFLTGWFRDWGLLRGRGGDARRFGGLLHTFYFVVLLTLHHWE